MDLKVRPSRIIYANPCKQSSHIKFAAKHNVSMMTFDNEAELHKVAEKLYKSEAAGAEGMPPNPGAPEGDAGAGGGADDDVIDAEFTEPSDK